MDENLSDIEVEKETDVVKCKQCGANMRFDADTQSLLCDHCGASVDLVKDTAVTEKDFLTSQSDTSDWKEDDTVVYRCNNCGAKAVATKQDIALICPFCGTSNIIETDELPGIKPGAVFPFTVSRESCVTSCKAWLKRKWFVPNDFKKRQDFAKMGGVYNPAWTFNSLTESYYHGTLGKHYTVTVGSGKNQRTETRTRYFRIQGNWNDDFRDVMIEASPELDKKTFDKLRPFRKETAVVYSKKYLAGFSACHYDKDVNTSFTEAKNEMEQTIKTRILNQYTYDVISSFTCYTKHSNVTFKYILLPVWIGNYAYREKNYRYYINGNTGKVTGKVPRSGWKIFRFFGILFAIAGICAGVAALLSSFGIL